MFKVLFLSKIYPACHLDVNGIKPASNSIMTDNHTTEHSKTASLGIIIIIIIIYSELPLYNGGTHSRGSCSASVCIYTVRHIKTIKTKYTLSKPVKEI